MKRFLAIVIGVAVLGILASHCAAWSPGPEPTAARTEANITRLTAQLLEQSQFAHHPLDRELAERLLDTYLDALDGSRSIFLETDTREFASALPNLAKATREAGDTGLAHRVFRRYLKRLGQRNAYITSVLHEGPAFEFTGHDVYAPDRSDAARPADLTAAQALWLQQLRASYLDEMLEETTPAEASAKLKRRALQQLKSMRALRSDEVLAIYLDALTHVYDPHSDYLGRDELEDFTISMKLSLFGIGASLREEDGYCTIQALLPGGPAAHAGVLQPGDRIVSVGQASKEPVDVTNLPLSRIVALIRGPKGSRVTLEVLHAGAPDASAPELVSLVRDEINLEDQEAKARIVDMPQPDGTTLRIGVLDVPEFYADLDDRRGAHGRSVTADVKRLLARLRAEHVRGIVVDLRNNGGGSLSEAISLTGLFIGRGPVVQTRDAEGHVEVDEDTDESIDYDGPLVVLTSRMTASASEIFAGALQDYGRALIVGDSQTFGKGTVQNILPLERVMAHAGLSHTFDPGALKITVQKFYRPGGASTQLRGVAADIVLPSVTDFGEVNESALKNPLPWDAVPSSRYPQLQRVKPFVRTLRAKSEARRASDTVFADIESDAARLREVIASKTISLNESERRAEADEAKARQQARERELADFSASEPRSYTITLANAASTQLPPPDGQDAAAKPTQPQSAAQDGASVQALAREAILHESEQILADYVRLHDAAKRTKAPRPDVGQQRVTAPASSPL